MSQERQIVPIDGRKLVLGFDAGCATCTGLAQRIREQVGEELEVLSLRDPRVEQWRSSALGDDTPWAPTLVEVDGLKVRAWTGWRLGLRLSRFLGPAATWRIMQALGEVGATPKIEHSAMVEKLPERAAGVVVGMSRGRFLKGVGGTAVAMSMLTGVGPLAGRAGALEPWQYPASVGFRQLKGEALKNACNRVAARTSCEWTSGSENLPALRSGFEVTSADDQIAQGSGVQGRAGVHTLANGSRMFVYTIAFQRTEKLVSIYEYETARRGIKWEVKRWGLNSTGTRLIAERAYLNNTPCENTGARSTLRSLRSGRSSCPQECFRDGSQQALQTTCSSIDWECAENLIFGGITGCAGAKVTCKEAKGWVLIVCAASAYLCYDTLTENCCRQTCTVCVDCYNNTM